MWRSLPRKNHNQIGDRMTKNRENWLYSDASGLYFQHDGFVMRASDGKQYDIEEECELLNKYDIENRELKTLVHFYKSFQKDARELEKENRQLKQQIKDLRTDVLNSIHKANETECCCVPCVVEKCVKRVIE